MRRRAAVATATARRAWTSDPSRSTHPVVRRHRVSVRRLGVFFFGGPARRPSPPWGPRQWGPPPDYGDSRAPRARSPTPAAGRWGPCGSRFRFAKAGRLFSLEGLNAGPPPIGQSANGARYLPSEGLNAGPPPIGQSANGGPLPTTAIRALRALGRRPQRRGAGAPAARAFASRKLAARCRAFLRSGLLRGTRALGGYGEMPRELRRGTAWASRGANDDMTKSVPGAPRGPLPIARELRFARSRGPALRA